MVGHAFSVPSGILRQAGALPYWPLWLRCDAQWVERHPALGDFPHDGISGFQFMRLFSSGVPTVDFTPRDALARKHFQPIVAGMSLIPWTEDASRFNYALAYGAMLSECRLGAGRVLVCNLWVLDGVRRGFPEAGYLLDCLVSYAAAEARMPSCRSSPPRTPRRSSVLSYPDLENILVVDHERGNANPAVGCN